MPSNISWTDETWNPLVGCSVISPGCKHCYAMTLAQRLEHMGMPQYQGTTRQVNDHAVWTGQVKFVEDALPKPLHWKKPRRIFVNSMSDLFHENVPFAFLERIFDVMQRASWHQFQVLTKRSERLLELARKLPWPQQVWMGVSVENEDYTCRIDQLRQTPANIKFLSLEPLLGPLPSLNLENIHWVIVGGESGPRYRRMPLEWLESIVEQCHAAHVKVHIKQDSARHPGMQGRIPDRLWVLKEHP